MARQGMQIFGQVNMKDGLSKIQAVQAWTALAAFLFVTATYAEIDADQLPFVTQHKGTFNGQALEYTATVGSTVVKDAGGRPTVRFVTTAYVRKDMDIAARPVLFVFNGGPSSASATLHMVGLGPKRIAVTQDPKRPAPDPARVVDNKQTVLDVADLVFIDPPETGFTRVLPSARREDFYSTLGDAGAVADFVETWSRDNYRERSPKFLLGESYGTLRAAVIAGRFAGTMPLDGVFLFGQTLNTVEATQRAKNALGYAANLPTLAAIASYHGKVDRKGKTPPAFIDVVYKWGMHEYLDALIAGRDLPEASRQRIAKQLQAWTGIGANYYLAHDLVITNVEFARELLKSRGLILGTYDARYTGPAPKAGEKAIDPFAKVEAATIPMLQAYFKNALDVTFSMSDYRESVPPDAAKDWKYTPTSGTGGPFSDYDYPAALDAAFAANPKFRLVIGTGIYDLTTTLGPARYLVAQSHYPADRVFLRQYEGGHMAYTNESALVAFTSDIRAWITGAPLK
jgi:carboxypeptidase C (cathepsin A)